MTQVSAIVRVRAFFVRRGESGRWLRRRAVATLVGLALVTAIVPPHQFARAATTLVVDDDGHGTVADCAASAAASTTIQGAVAAAAVGGLVFVCPGTYTENVVVDERITLEGSGSGSDAASTIIESATASTDVIRLTAGGSSSTDRMVIRGLRVRGATGAGNAANGIEIAGGSGYTTFDDVAVVDNDGNGIAINTSGGDINNLEILNSTIDGNGGTGVRIPSSIGSLDGLLIDNTTISDSAGAGLATNPSASSLSITNVTVSNTTFAGNNAGNNANQQSMSLFGFRGNVNLQDVDVEHSNAGHAIQIDGRMQSGPPGTMELDGLAVTGSPGKTAILVQGFDGEDLSTSLRFTDVDLRGATPAWAQIAISHSAAPVNLGNTQFTAGGASAAAAIAMWGPGGADATGARFFDTSGDPVFDGSTIEDSIDHALDDPAVGEVTFHAGSVAPDPEPTPDPEPAPEPVPTLPPPAATVEAEPGETVEAGTGNVTAGVTVPVAGKVSVAVTEDVTEEPVTGLSFLQFQVEIEAPPATPDEPLTLDLRVEQAAVPEGTDAARLVVLRNGVPVPACTGPDGVAEPDPCVSRRSNDGGVGFTVLTSRASVWTVAVVEDACIEPLVPDPGFADVAGNTHESAIACLAWWDVSQGTSATTFEPGAKVARAQTASLLARTLAEAGVALPSDLADAFTDDERSIHEVAIDRLAALGVVAGLGDGAFGPNDPVTRGQLATLTVRLYELAAGTALPAGDDRFTDDDGDVHEANIDKAAAAGFTHGTTATTFGPDADVRRDQMASFVTRVLQRFVQDGLAAPPLD